MRFLHSFRFVVAPLLGAAVTAPAATLATASPVQISPRDPRIAYMGRVAFPTDAEARFGFPGITVRFKYRGPAPTVLLGAASATCYFNLSCNGWQPVIIHPPLGRSECPLPSGEAPAGGWVVEVVRRNESWQGVASFFGLTLPPGCELLAPPPFPQRRLMFIGDSITGGEYIDRMPPELDSTPRMANASRTFGMLLGRQFDAQVHLVSYGGRGVVRDWEGKTDTVNAPQFFERTLPDDAEPRWPHPDYVPDAVVICLGTNDFSRGLIDEAVYTEAYDQFVTQIKRAYPKTAIVLAESPIFGEAPNTPDRAKRNLLRRCLDQIVARRKAAGDMHIAVAPVRHQPGTEGNAHPSAFQHEQIAADILPKLKQVTGW